MLEEWDTDERGNVILHRLISSFAFSAAEVGVGLKIDFVWNRPGQESVRSSVQVGMTPEQSIELGEALQRFGRELLEPEPPETLRN